MLSRSCGTRRLTVLALAFTLAACASTGGSGAAPGSGDRHRIEADELATAEQLGSVLDAVRALRPQWLSGQRGHRTTTPGAPMVGEVVIYVDRARMGGPGVLASMSVGSAVRLQYYSPSAAQMRFGNGHENGVIEVFTRSGATPNR